MADKLGYEKSLRSVRIVAVLDIVFSIFPLAFYTVITFLFGFIVLVGAFNSGYDFLDWILQTMTVQEVKFDFDNPGQATDLRMYRCSVWGIAILFNLIELTVAMILINEIRKAKSERPFVGYIAMKALIVFVLTILIIALLSSGSSFLGLLLSIFYLVYRCVAIWIVYTHVKNIREIGGIP